MQGSEFFTALYLMVTVIGWCATAVVLFCKLLKHPWRQVDWIKCLLCCVAGGLGATVALIPLWIATTALVMLSFQIGNVALLLLLPWLLILAAVIVVWRALMPPTR